jgi:hypothetical protein
MDVRSGIYGLAVLEWASAPSSQLSADAGDGQLVFCPCRYCNNVRKWVNVEEIQYHLITKKFMRDYTLWTNHGEVGENVDGDKVPDLPSGSR